MARSYTDLARLVLVQQRRIQLLTQQKTILKTALLASLRGEMPSWQKESWLYELEKGKEVIRGKGSHSTPEPGNQDVQSPDQPA